MKRRLWFILKLCIGLGVFAFILSRVDITRSLGLVTQTRPEWLAAAMLCMLGGSVLQAARWQVILRTSGFLLSLTRVLAINFVGMFFNNFLPGSVGGDIVKVFYVADPRKCGQVITTAVLTRVIGMIATFGLGLAAIGFVSDVFRTQPWWPFCGVMLAAAACGCTFALTPIGERCAMVLLRVLPMPNKLRVFATDLVGPIRLWRGQRRAVAATAGLAVLFQIVGFVLVTYCCARSLDVRVPVADIAMVSAIAGIMFALPISVNGLGVAEGTSVYLFMLIGVAAERALLLALLFRALLLVQTLIGGAIYFFLKRRHTPNGEQ